MKTKRYGHVYVVENSKTGMVKIGYSKSPEMRAKHVSRVSAAGGRVFISGLLRDARTVERECHRAFAAGSAGGEWFAVGFDEAVARLQLCGAEPISQEEVEMIESGDILKTANGAEFLLAAIDRHFGKPMPADRLH